MHRPRQGLAGCCAAALLAAACSGDPSGPEPTPVPRAISLVVVAGDGQQGLAGSALTIPLKVKALGFQGEPVPGATVRWEVAAGLGSPTPSTSVTNALGETTTVWSLGHGSSRQTLVASVDGPAEPPPVEFTATVPVAEVDFVPLAETLWPDDAFAVRYVAKDPAGSSLLHAAVTLTSLTPEILGKRNDTTFRTNRWGRGRITAEGVPVTDTLEVAVPPLIRARVRSVGPDPLTGQSLVSVGSDGERVEAPAPPRGAEVELRLEELPTGPSLEVRMLPGPDSLHFPVLFPLDSSQFDRPVTLLAVPREWRIDQGAHAGERVRLSMDLLAGNPLQTPVPYVRGSFAVNGLSVMWPGQPLRKLVRFDTASSSTAHYSLPRDSLALWATLDSVEHSAGLDLFEQDPDRAVSDHGVVDVSVRLQSSAVIWGQQQGRYYFRFMSFEDFRESSGTGAVESVHFWSRARVAVRSPSVLTNLPTWEELALHLHGFDQYDGSKPGWCLFRSVKADCARLASHRYSVEDVAAMGVTHAIGRAALELIESPSLAQHPLGLASLFGERAEWLALDPVPLGRATSTSGRLGASGATPLALGRPDEPGFSYGYERNGALVGGWVPCSEAHILDIPEEVRSFLAPTIAEACGG